MFWVKHSCYLWSLQWEEYWYTLEKICFLFWSKEKILLSLIWCYYKGFFRDNFFFFFFLLGFTWIFGSWKILYYFLVRLINKTKSETISSSNFKSMWRKCNHVLLKKWAKSVLRKKSEAIKRNLCIYIMHYGGPGAVKNYGDVVTTVWGPFPNYFRKTYILCGAIILNVFLHLNSLVAFFFFLHMTWFWNSYFR